jgi:hypothetical protein
MLTNRFSKIAALLVVVTVALLTASFLGNSAPAASPSSLSDDAHYQFRLGEREAAAAAVDARYEFRLGEIAEMAKPVDARAEFRLGEIAEMAQPIDARYEFRKGEWTGN